LSVVDDFCFFSDHVVVVVVLVAVLICGWWVVISRRRCCRAALSAATVATFYPPRAPASGSRDWVVYYKPRVEILFSLTEGENFTYIQLFFSSSFSRLLALFGILVPLLLSGSMCVSLLAPHLLSSFSLQSSLYACR